jgi:hypothetical protein
LPSKRARCAKSPRRSLATYLGVVEAGAGQKMAPKLVAFLADSHDR